MPSAGVDDRAEIKKVLDRRRDIGNACYCCSGDVAVPCRALTSLTAFVSCTGPVKFHWINSAFLPVIVSIDFSSGSWSDRCEVRGLAE